MSKIIAAIGPPSTGKSASMRTLDPDETFIVSCIGKTPPFQGWSDDYPEFTKENREEGRFYDLDVPPRQMANKLEWILNAINEKRKDVKVVVIDDFQYVLSFQYMDRALENGWDKFTEMGVSIFDVINNARQMRDDLMIVFLSHSADKSDASHGMEGFKTIGKMLDKHVDLEGLFNIILFSERVDGEYRFLTQTDGERIARSPMGMFDERIPNDLGMVVDRIREYN